MKVTKTLLALALAGVSSASLAAPVAWTGEFTMYNGSGFQMDANDGGAGLAAAVTGTIDVDAGTFTLASNDTFFGINWSTSGGTLFGPGSYTHSTVDPAPAYSGGDYNFTVGAGQLGAVVDFAWGSNTGIDVLMIWNVNTAGGITSYSMTDPDGDGIPGTGMIDGPFVGFNANFNMQHAALSPTVPPIPEASTYGMMLAGLGLVGFAVRRRKTMA